jgi:hypothetical protein
MLPLGCTDDLRLRGWTRKLMSLASEYSRDWSVALQALQQIADTEPIRPNNGSPGWLSAASDLALTDPGVLAALGPGKLSCLSSGHVRTSLCLDGPGVIAAAVAVSSARRGHQLAFAVAPGARDLPLFVAAVAILGDTVRDALLPEPKHAGFLIVSSDLELRAKYCTLQIASESIDAAYPGLRLSTSGRAELIDTKRAASEARRGVCFMYPTKTLPASVSLNPGYVIVDLRYGRESKRAYDIVAWTSKMFPHAGILALYTTGDTWTESELSRVLAASFVFDHQAVATCKNQLRKATARGDAETNAFTLNAAFGDSLKYLERHNEIRYLDNSEHLERLFSSLHTTLFGGMDYRDPAVRRAMWLYSTLRDFPIPLKYYERAAQAAGKYTLKRMIDGLRQLLRMPKLGPLVQSLGVLYIELYKALLNESLRANGLLNSIEDAFLSQDEEIVLLCKDATAAAALDLWLTDNFGSELQLLSRVSAIKFADAWLLQRRNVGVSILSGVLPAQHRWLYGANLGRTAIHLCAPSQATALKRALNTPLDPLINGRYVNSRYSTLSKLLGHQIPGTGKDSTLRQINLTGEPDAMSAGETNGAETPNTAAGYIRAQEPRQKHKLRTIGHGLESLSALLTDSQPEKTPEPIVEKLPDAPRALFEDDDPDDCASSESRRARAVIGVRDSQRVRLYLDEQRTYEVISHGESAGIAYLSPGQLSPGDILLLTDSIGRLSVFDQMLSIIEGAPKLKSLISYRRAWNAAVQHLKGAGSLGGQLDYGVLLRKLRVRGADIESELTVKNWIEGRVIGPAKITSITAVGQLIESTDMVQRAGEYDNAFRSIRSIHQTLGRHIGNILRGAKEDFAFAVHSTDYHIEPAFAFPLRELMQSIVPIEIEWVDENTATIAHAALHRQEQISP